MEKTMSKLESIVVSFVSCVAALAFAGCGASPEPEAVGDVSQADSEGPIACPAEVPAALAPAADETLAFALAATGVQIYDCKTTVTGHGWVFRAPDAVLFDSDGEVVGSHYAGPTWQSDDGSLVVAARRAGATVDATAIPWLLLGAVSHTGDGRMANVTSIQRLDTTGGLAPATGCDADHVGARADVPYTAGYFFYRTKEHGGVRQCGTAGE
jgi:hypothetical protein